MDKTQEKMNFVTKKLSAMLKTNDMGTLYTIMCLSFILFILVAAVIFTWAGGYIDVWLYNNLLRKTKMAETPSQKHLSIHSWKTVNDSFFPTFMIV